MPHWLQESGLLEDMFAILGCQPFKAVFFFGLCLGIFLFLHSPHSEVFCFTSK